MAGCAEILAAHRAAAERLWVLLPNRRALELAVAAGARNLHLLLSATESHSRANLGCSLGARLEELAAMGAELASGTLRSRVALSMAWHDPDEGPVPCERAADLCARLHDYGFREITLCDTYGAASPRSVARLVEMLAPLFPPERLVVHLHDTFGFAALNTLAALAVGVTRSEASLGGLGGCPFAPGAKGNMAGEDLVRLLQGLGVDSGLELGELSALKDEIEALIRE